MKTYADLIKYEMSETQMSIPTLRCSGWAKLPQSFYITDKIFSPCHFSIFPNQFIHHEDRESMFLWNVGTFIHYYTVQAPKRIPSYEMSFTDICISRVR
jgi:hypothetical protein